MQALQDLGVALVALDPAALAALDLPERLVDAIALARAITRHEARRRQMQYIGRLMRESTPSRSAMRSSRWQAGPARARAFALPSAGATAMLRRAGGVRRSSPRIRTPRDVLAGSSREARAERRAAAAAQVRARCSGERIIDSAPVGDASRRSPAWDTGHADRPLLIGLVSISDRASAGVYEDQGLPALTDWFGAALATPWTGSRRASFPTSRR